MLVPASLTCFRYDRSSVEIWGAFIETSLGSRQRLNELRGVVVPGVPMVSPRACGSATERCSHLNEKNVQALFCCCHYAPRHMQSALLDAEHSSVPVLSATHR